MGRVLLLALLSLSIAGGIAGAADAEPAKVTLQPGTDAARGAAVTVNGKQVGTVPIAISLRPGRYLIRVSKQGHTTFERWLDVAAGEKQTLSVDLPRASADTGALLVAVNVPDALVYVDGRETEKAPALVEQLSAGRHVVEARAPGHQPQSKHVEVLAGKTVKVTLTLAPLTPAAVDSGGTLQVLANKSDVEIRVDGVTRGKTPAKIENLAEGTHVVEASGEGLKSLEREVTITKGQLTTVKLTLEEAETPRRSGSVRVVSPLLGAMVFIDGRFVGKTPLLKHGIDPGPHFVSVRQKGYQERVSTVEVKANQTAQVEATLEPLATSPTSAPAVGSGDTPTDDEQLDAVRGVASYGAMGVPAGSLTVDASLGYPYLLQARLTAGLLTTSFLGLDGGIHFRTFGSVSEVGFHSKLRLLRYDILSAALRFALGGGGGPNSRNTFFTEFGAVGSLHFKDRVTFSGRAFFNFYTDRVCPSGAEANELTICSDPRSAGLTQREVRDRIGGVRFFLSVIAEVAVTRHLNVFAIFEGVPFQSRRHLFTDPFASVMAASDPGAYFRLGVTFKR